MIIISNDKIIESISEDGTITMKSKAKKLSYDKIVSVNELKNIISKKSSSKKVVFTNGCFDIIHPGHVDLLERASMLGDILVVGLNSDNSVKRLNKGPGRPFNSFEERAYVLAHLSSVDYVVCFDEDTPENIIHEIRPDVLVKGGDWKISDIVGSDYVQSYGGKVYSLFFMTGYSTTELVNKILKTAK